MTQFHEGQEVEVKSQIGPLPADGPYAWKWRRAKITDCATRGGLIEVLFDDTSIAVFDADHIRAV
jgi:hypothetical protein